MPSNDYGMHDTSQVNHYARVLPKLLDDDLKKGDTDSEVYMDMSSREIEEIKENEHTYEYIQKYQ